ncbi:MAG: cellulose biosynthesis protein BcsG [Burkholderiales bacterium]|nr:cellulose biosynthesis protein BcsG [Burkholderiales bacterium]
MARPIKVRPRLKWTGLGLWNVFFIGEFLLAAEGYLHLDLAYNCILAAFVLIPIRNKPLSWLRTLICMCGAFAMVYSESWWPSIESIQANAHNLAVFETGYLIESVLGFVNWEMVGIGAVLVIVYLALKDYVRISTITLLWLFALVCAPVWKPLVDAHIANAQMAQCPPTTATTEQNTEENKVSKNGLLAQTEEPTNMNLDRWLRAFYDKERERKVQFPDKLGKDDTPFDILLVNICSLSNADLKAVDLAEHAVFNQFNIIFTNFNSATSYSGPAALRLLTSLCGQPSHSELYEGRNPECEILNRLDDLGYTQRTFMDHSGTYDSFIQSLRNIAGFKPELQQPMPYPKRYESFDEEPIGDAKAVFADWVKQVKENKDVRNATFFNLIALHDGNRRTGQKKLAPFKPRAHEMLDDIQGFIKEIEESGRKVMLVIVPEHGAAEEGDKVQVAKLRDIPSISITNVPVMVKFIGIKDQQQIKINEPVSYLALADLIGRTLETNFFSTEDGAIPLTELTANLPQTEAVSENGNAKVVSYQGKDYVKLEKGDWREYAK